MNFFFHLAPDPGPRSFAHFFANRFPKELHVVPRQWRELIAQVDTQHGHVKGHPGFEPMKIIGIA